MRVLPALKPTSRAALLGAGAVLLWLLLSWQFLRPVAAQPSTDLVNGLLGTYTQDDGFGGLIERQRLDPQIDFDWDLGAPWDELAADYFDVRWTGYLQVPTDNLYTFYATTDDGVRLYIDDELVFERWLIQAPTETQATLQLTAGQFYALRVEYFEATGGASARLEWSSPTLARQVVPQSVLFVETDFTPQPSATPSATQQGIPALDLISGGWWDRTTRPTLISRCDGWIPPSTSLGETAIRLHGRTSAVLK